jgi:hypothetical protein
LRQASKSPVRVGLFLVSMNCSGQHGYVEVNIFRNDELGPERPELVLLFTCSLKLSWVEVGFSAERTSSTQVPMPPVDVRKFS